MPDIVKLRFSTKCLKRLVDELKPDQKDFLHRNGLGAFIHIKDFHVPFPKLEWVMRNMLVPISQFRHGNNSIKFTKVIIRNVIGLPPGGIEVCDENVDEELLKEAQAVERDYPNKSKCPVSTVVRMCLAEHNE